MLVAVLWDELMNQWYVLNVIEMCGTKVDAFSPATPAKTIYAKTTCSNTRQAANIWIMSPTSVKAVPSLVFGRAYAVKFVFVMTTYVEFSNL